MDNNDSGGQRAGQYIEEQVESSLADAPEAWAAPQEDPHGRDQAEAEEPSKQESDTASNDERTLDAEAEFASASGEVIPASRLIPRGKVTKPSVVKIKK